MDPSLNPLRILVVGGQTERRHEVAGAIESLGHQVILEAHLARVGAATAAERPDVAIVVVGEGSREALAGIGTIVHEAACPVIAILDVEDPLFIREAANGGSSLTSQAWKTLVSWRVQSTSCFDGSPNITTSRARSSGERSPSGPRAS
jgi:hypothetical protein